VHHLELVIPVAAATIGVLVLLLATEPLISRGRELRRGLIEHLALAAGRGLPLGAAIAALAEESRPGGGRLRLALERLAGRVDQGAGLAAALAATPELGVTAEQVALLRAAEPRGALPAVLGQLARQLEADEAGRATLHAAAAYPLVLGALVGGIGLFHIVVVSPKLEEVFEALGAATGPFLEAWWGLSRALSEDAGPLLLSVALVAITGWFARRSLLRRLGSLARRAPLVGPPLRRRDAGLALQRAGALVLAGATLPEALDALGEAGAAAAVSAAATAREGRGAVEVLERLLGRDAPALLPRVLLELERAPSFGAGLVAAGEGLVARATDRLRALLEQARPLPIVACALFVGVVHLSVWLPLTRVQAAFLEAIR
jgi:type II secretory pathway component PulF